jgi:hypothetical protein
MALNVWVGAPSAVITLVNEWKVPNVCSGVLQLYQVSNGRLEDDNKLGPYANDGAAGSTNVTVCKICPVGSYSNAPGGAPNP